MAVPVAVAVAGSALIEEQSLVAGTDVFHINTAASRSCTARASTEGGRKTQREREMEMEAEVDKVAHRKCRSGQTQSERALLFWPRLNASGGLIALPLSLPLQRT